MVVPYERVTAAPLDPRAIPQMVPMRDGVLLATDVYLASRVAQPGPVILIRLPYDKCGLYTGIPAIAALMNERGYHVVAQDVRGKFRSEGETVFAIHEAADGYDTIDWIVAQPWADGAVAMWGDSYYGLTQFAAASTGHPALRAIAPRVTGTRLGELPTRAEGSRTSDVEMGVHRLYSTMFFQSNDTYFWEPEWSRRPLVDAVEDWFATIGERSATFDRWMSDRAVFDVDADERFPFGHPFDAPAIPTLMTIGYWDNCAHWQWSDHAMIQQRPEWAECEYLLLEAIDHENYSFDDIPIGPHNDHSVNLDAFADLLPRYVGPALDFFDVFVRGVGSPGDVPRVRYSVAGTIGRYESPTWPPPNTVTVFWYPTTGGVLASQPPPATELSWVHDPDSPVPSPVENAFAFLAEYPDERALSDRADVVGFVTEPFGTAVALVGPIEFAAVIASSGPEMDLFVRLCDVSPDGTTHLIARGQITLFDATEAAHVVVAMGHTGYLVNAGDRLRLTLASSDSPEFVVAPGTEEHRWLATTSCRTDQTIQFGEVTTLSATVARA